MKRKIIKYLILSLLFPGFVLGLFAQKVSINYVDVNGYPYIKAGYTFLDATDNQVRPPNYNWMPQDIIINERGVRVHNTGSPSCPNPIDRTFSAILVFDVSNTMQKGLDGSTNPPPGGARWELAVEAMKDFISALDPNLTECAIIQFASNAKIIHRFSNNKDSLRNSLTLGNITLAVGTNYNAAFIIDRYRDSTSTALWMAKSAKYKPVIIFLTDGNHETQWGAFINPPTGDGRFFIGDVINLARERNTYVFCIKIGNDVLSGTNQGYLNGLAGIEGSPGTNLEMDVTDKARLSDFYNKVLQICGTVGYPAPCYVEWKSECLTGGAVSDLQLSFPNHGNLTASTTFTVPDNIQPSLEISPNPIPFNNVNFDTNKVVTVRLTARKNFVEFNGPPGFISSDPRYKVQDWGTAPPPPFPYKLLKDLSMFITVRYDPTDSSYSSATIDLNSSACSGDIINVSGMMNLFCKDVDMGDCTVSDSVSATVTQLFCNRSSATISVTGLDITTGDYKMFDTVITDPPIPCVLDTGECLKVTFRFKPSSSGGKAARLTLKTSSGNFLANIIGNGIGQPGITANPLIFQNTDCKYPTRIDTVFLMNTGPLPLTIVVDSSGLIGPNASEFDTVGTPGIPNFIPANGTEKVIIQFNPQSPLGQLKECFLRIVSNAGNSHVFDVRVEGFADSVNFAPPDTTINLGVVCLGDNVVTNIPLRNVGTKDLHIDATTIPSSFTLPVRSWDLNGGENTIINTTYIPYKDGDIDTVLILTENFCPIQKTIRFTGTVHDPRVTYTPMIVTSTVNTKKDTSIVLTNPSPVGLDIDNIVFDDPQFIFDSSAQRTPCTLLQGESITVYFHYTPTSTVPIDTNLRLKGMPCWDVLVPIIGNPSQATVDIAIDPDSGYVGEIKSFPVILRNANKFAASGTTSINADISFDASLLKQPLPKKFPDTTVAGITTVMLRNIKVKQDDNEQKPDSLILEVTDGNVDSTYLVFSSTVTSDKNNVIFNRDDGLFRLIEASATLYTKNYEKFPGEEFLLEIWQKDAKNLSPAFHQSITTEVRCNAYVLEGVNLPFQVINGERIVTLNNIPVINSPDSFGLTTFKFRPMLGPVDTTYIILQNSRSVNGKIKFDTVVSKLTLKGVCVDADGTKRLFDPTREPAKLEAVNPNPTNGITEIKFTLSEPGVTNIWISNVLGDKLLNVANDEMNPGSKTLYFDANDLPDGVYFVIMQTPTQLFRKRFNIIK